MSNRGHFSDQKLDEMSEEELLYHYRNIRAKIDELQSESSIRRIQSELKELMNILVMDHEWSRGRVNKLVGKEDLTQKKVEELAR